MPFECHARRHPTSKTEIGSFAASYLGLGVSTVREHGPKPKRWGSRVLYDRRDLDRWADALDGQPLDEKGREAEADDALNRIKERLAHGQE